MWQKEFEAKLSKKTSKRRWTTGLICLGLLALFILFMTLREFTKEVIVHDGYIFLPAWEEVRYNSAYIPLCVFSFLGSFLAGIFLLCDFLFCKLYTFEHTPHFITVYRGMLHNTVYVDGKEADTLGPFTYRNVVEIKLPTGVKAIVSFGRYHSQISYSDDTPSVEF